MVDFFFSFPKLLFYIMWTVYFLRGILMTFFQLIYSDGEMEMFTLNSYHNIKCNCTLYSHPMTTITTKSEQQKNKNFMQKINIGLTQHQVVTRTKKTCTTDSQYGNKMFFQHCKRFLYVVVVVCWVFIDIYVFI